MSESEGQEGIFDRRMIFPETLLSKYNTTELYTTCGHCNQFLAVCYSHSGYTSSSDLPCHHYPVVFVDGSCARNSFVGAFSGIGGLFGDIEEYQWKIPVDADFDPVPIRTSHRAELLASIEGVQRFGKFLQSDKWDPPRDSCKTQMVVATDSEYVYRGVTEWMPKWKVRAFYQQHIHPSDFLLYKINGWQTSSGKPAANQDLFRTLDEALAKLEHAQINVGFWKIDRQVHVARSIL
jgi:ribonuclease HI